MASKKSETVNTPNPYSKIEGIIMEKVFVLEAENAQLRTELAAAKAKLSVYERLATVSDSRVSLGFGPPVNNEGGV